MFRSKTKVLQLAVTLLACAFLLVPTILSVMAGLTVNYFKGISSGLTLKWVYQVWELYSESIFLSIWLALACLIVTLIIGLPAAYGLARHPGWLSRMLEEFISLPLAVPGLALALALLQLYGTLKGFRASWTFILVGHVLYTLPFMVRSILAVLAAMDLKTLEEGGRDAWRLPLAKVPRYRGAQCHARHSGWCPHGRDVVAWRIQPDLDVAHTLPKNLAGRARR